MRIPENVKMNKEAVNLDNVRIEMAPPKNNCKKCHGTGRLGFYDGDETRPMRCRCTVKIVKITPEELAKMKAEAEAKRAKVVEPTPGVKIVESKETTISAKPPGSEPTVPEAKPEADKSTA